MQALAAQPGLYIYASLALFTCGEAAAVPCGKVPRQQRAVCIALHQQRPHSSQSAAHAVSRPWAAAGALGPHVSHLAATGNASAGRQKQVMAGRQAGIVLLLV
jgi:hypothetical protein